MHFGSVDASISFVLLCFEIVSGACYSDDGLLRPGGQNSTCLVYR